MKHIISFVLILAMSAVCDTSSAVPQGSEFTYQGNLEQNSAPANGAFDFEFRVFDAPVGGMEMAPSMLVDDLDVDTGIFTTVLDFGDAPFSGDRVYLEIAVRQGADTGAYTLLSPRQEITSAPYALHAQFVGPNSVGTPELQNNSVGASQIISSQVQERVNGSCPEGQSIRVINSNGSVLCETDDTGASGNAWLTTGNGGTTAGLDFLGTTDAEPMEIHVEGARVLRLEPSAGSLQSPNVLSGHNGNTVGSGFGASVVHGGSPFDTNQANNDGVTISGGFGQTANGLSSTISGGRGHTADGEYATVGGGQGHNGLADHSTVAGGNLNTVVSAATAGTVGGGERNDARAPHSVVAGGSFNNTNTSLTYLEHSTISGGAQNIATGSFSVIAGGSDNVSENFHTVIGGGQSNRASDSHSVVSGGESNMSDGDHSTVAGGETNMATGDHSTVSGGLDNTASGFWDVVSGGTNNQASGSLGVVSGGVSNQSRGNGSVVPGGRNNVAGGDNSWAGGYGAIVRDPAQSGDPDGDQGTFAWDGQIELLPSDLTSSGKGQFLVRSPGGAWFGTGSGSITPDLQNAAMLIESTDAKTPMIARSAGATVMTLQDNGGLTIGSGNSAAANGLHVDGNTLMEGSAEIEGNTDLLSNLTVSGETTINDSLEVNSSATIGSSIAAPSNGLRVQGEAYFFDQIGIGTESPAAQVQIDAPSGEGPLRARVNGATKLWVMANGGVAVGSPTGPGPNGLRVAGDASIIGNLSKGGGSFKIDHPLDPENQFLYHSFVESPDMMNVYNGNVMLDSSGEAWVELPDYFQALNREFRYQLTAVGQPGPSLFVATEIEANQFQIAGGAPGMKVSWQVTGVRQDPWAEQNRIPVEVEKSAQEKGRYLHAEAWGIEDRHKSMNHASETPQDD